MGSGGGTVRSVEIRHASGHQLGVPVKDERGRILLAAGTSLTAGLCDALIRRGFLQVLVRDGIADALGINDRDKRIQWLTAQLPKAKGNGMGCSIDITGDTDESGPARSRYCPNCGMALCARDMELGRCQNCPSPKKELA